MAVVRVVEDVVDFVCAVIVAASVAAHGPDVVLPGGLLGRVEAPKPDFLVVVPVRNLSHLRCLRPLPHAEYDLCGSGSGGNSRTPGRRPREVDEVPP